MKNSILLHDASTNFPIDIANDMIAVCERTDDGKTCIYFKHPLQDDDGNEYPAAIVNETVEKIYKLRNE
ncbi:MAG: hypothetical protein [Wendovervirus sonii]|uniref:Phage protein n=1 Tax=phage Lak_Megaphage_Sonny TaxID=3109229 RepID=A0ABZ0Z3M4_9CAUD|nr:MAG: hypothetical protein [phage Lak_Megaphage_Sonny]